MTGYLFQICTQNTYLAYLLCCFIVTLDIPLRFLLKTLSTSMDLMVGELPIRFSTPSKPAQTDNFLLIPGLHEFICSTLRLSESVIKRNFVVHEMIVSDDDAKSVYNNRGQSPWPKSAAAYRRNDNARRNEEHPKITRIELHSTNGQWLLVDDPRVCAQLPPLLL